MTYEEWWNKHGSGLIEGEDTESHTKRVTELCWNAALNTVRPSIAAIHCNLVHGPEISESLRLALIDECEFAVPGLKQLRNVSKDHIMIDKTLEERGTRYGEFTEHASISQSIKRSMNNSKNWESLRDDQREALEMIAHKIARILNGDPDYHDSWYDIIGYSKLVADKLS